MYLSKLEIAGSSSGFDDTYLLVIGYKYTYI